MPAEAVCIASGPSLTAEQVAQVQAWRQASDDRVVLVVNTSFRIAPWADVLYGMDSQWWRAYGEEVAASFPGKRVTNAIPHPQWRVLPGAQVVPGWQPFGNSGAGAIYLAARLGARRVGLIGYDCRTQPQRKHWHPDHPGRLGNCGSIASWPYHFGQLAKWLCEVEITNCTPGSALKAFPAGVLEEWLAHDRCPA